MDDERESNRLKNKVIPDLFIKKYIQPIVKNDSPINILDVGCGSGVITSSLANKFKTSFVTGIDLSHDRFSKEKNKHANLNNLKFVQGSAESMPFNSNHFDIVFIRFLLEYIKSPSNVIKEMLRVLKNGGIILLQDIDGQLCTHYPENDSIQKRLTIILNHLSISGFDPYIGRKLFHYAKKESIVSIDLQVEPYHLFAGQIDSVNESLWELKLDIALPEISKALGSTDKANCFKIDYMNFLRDENTITFSNLFTLTGKKKIKC